MVQTICKNCNKSFWLPVVVIGTSTCPCQTYVAIWNEGKKDYKKGKKWEEKKDGNDTSDRV